MEKRWKTRCVQIGDVRIGGGLPVQIQSMTNTDTNDIAQTTEQIMRLVDAGAKIVRMTVQGKKEAKSCEKIKNLLRKKGYGVPLVADIHFYPPAALLAAEFMDKIRINPGNFADVRAHLQKKNYTEKEFQQGRARIEEKFTPLIHLCKKNRVAIRIGTNHGSLSDRIMNTYGDTPQGMVESAVEFGEICRKEDFHDLVFSMKSSNPSVMITAYRLLVEKMLTLGWDYPLHLGVTEAGSKMDGRMKSFVGMGTLLLEGIGDTIRVSLTEDPVAEIAPAKELVAYCEEQSRQKLPLLTTSPKRKKRLSRKTKTFSLIVPLSLKELDAPELFSSLGFEEEKGQYVTSAQTPDGIFLQKSPAAGTQAAEQMRQLLAEGVDVVLPAEVGRWTNISFVQSDLARKPTYFQWLRGKNRNRKHRLGDEQEQIQFLHLQSPREYWGRAALEKIPETTQAILFARYGKNEALVGASTDLGALLSDGFGAGICLDLPLSVSERRLFAFSLLQATRLRSFKTEFISCPSCGRTLFDLEEVTERIRKKTGHLPGVKIAVMGCIVNGPGEMADADFGYVGTRPGKIDLYIGKTRVKRNIDSARAEDELIALIRQEGRWVEPKEPSLPTI